MAGPAYATTDELDAYLTDSPYELIAPPLAARLLARASELINSKTRRLAQEHWTDPLDAQVNLAASVAGTTINTSSTHSLLVGDLVFFTSLSGGQGLSPGRGYFVRSGVTGTTFTVATTEDGAAVAFTTDIVSGIASLKTEFQDSLTRAALAQVEFWIEVGEEYDVVGLQGSAQVGRVNISKLPSRLGPRAMDILSDSGLMMARVSIR